jgi:hypothetical protein
MVISRDVLADRSAVRSNPMLRNLCFLVLVVAPVLGLITQLWLFYVIATVALPVWLGLFARDVRRAPSLFGDAPRRSPDDDS